MNKQRLTTAILVSAYFIYYTMTYKDWHFLDSANLIIHEAGHIVFIPFGLFMTILGGSLLQILFPILFAIYFYRQQQYFSASLLLFWIGQNILNISVYAADAIVMQLPLLGGDNAGHDWNNLLAMTDTLKYTDIIGKIIYTIGIIVILLAIFASLINSSADKKTT